MLGDRGRNSFQGQENPQLQRQPHIPVDGEYDDGDESGISEGEESLDNQLLAAQTNSLHHRGGTKLTRSPYPSRSSLRSTMSRTPTPPALGTRERKAKARVRFTGGHGRSQSIMPWIWPLLVFCFMITLMIMWEGGMRSAIFGTLESISQIRRSVDPA